MFCYGEELLALRATPKLEDHHLSAARDCLFNIFAAILLIGGRSTIRNLRTRHPTMTDTHLSRVCVKISDSNINRQLCLRVLILRL